MECRKFEDCNFHDLRIKCVDYNGKVLTLHAPESYYDNTYIDLLIEIPIDKDDLNIYYLRQYPKHHNVTFKGKEISLSSLKSLLKKGFCLEICDFHIAQNENNITIECDVFPYDNRAGVYRKVFLQLANVDKLFLKNEKSCG